MNLKVRVKGSSLLFFLCISLSCAYSMGNDDCLNNLTGLAKKSNRLTIQNFNDLQRFIDDGYNLPQHLNLMVHKYSDEIKEIIATREATLQDIVDAEIFEAKDLDLPDSGLKHVLKTKNKLFYFADSGSHFSPFNKKGWGTFTTNAIGFHALGDKRILLDDNSVLHVLNSGLFRITPLTNKGHHGLADLLSLEGLNSELKYLIENFDVELSRFLQESFHVKDELANSHVYSGINKANGEKAHLLHIGQEVYLLSEQADGALTWKVFKQGIGFHNDIELHLELNDGSLLTIVNGHFKLIPGHDFNFKSFIDHQKTVSIVNQRFYNMYAPLLEQMLKAEVISLDDFVFSRLKMGLSIDTSSIVFIIEDIQGTRHFIYPTREGNQLNLNYRSEHNLSKNDLGEYILVDDFTALQVINGIGFVKNNHVIALPLAEQYIQVMLEQKLAFILDRAISKDELNVITKVMTIPYSEAMKEKVEAGISLRTALKRILKDSGFFSAAEINILSRSQLF